MNNKIERYYDIEGWELEINNGIVNWALKTKGNTIRAHYFNDIDKGVIPLEYKRLVRRNLWPLTNISLDFNSRNNFISGSYLSPTISASVDTFSDGSDLEFYVSVPRRNIIYPNISNANAEDYKYFLDSFYEKGIELRYNHKILKCVDVNLPSDVSDSIPRFESTFVQTDYIHPDYNPQRKHFTDNGQMLAENISWSKFSRHPKKITYSIELAGPATETLEVFCCPEPDSDSTVLGLTRRISVSSPDPEIKNRYGSSSSVLMNLPTKLGEFVKQPDLDDPQAVLSCVESFGDFFTNMAISIK
jgi:hypothetical protein